MYIMKFWIRGNVLQIWTKTHCLGPGLHFHYNSTVVSQHWQQHLHVARPEHQKAMWLAQNIKEPCGSPRTWRTNHENKHSHNCGCLGVFDWSQDTVRQLILKMPPKVSIYTTRFSSFLLQLPCPDFLLGSIPLYLPLKGSWLLAWNWPVGPLCTPHRCKAYCKICLTPSRQGQSQQVQSWAVCMQNRQMSVAFCYSALA